MRRQIVLFPLVSLMTASALAPPIASAQVQHVVPGWGVDTTGVMSAWSEVSRVEDVRAIYRRWVDYLTSNPRQFDPTELWAAEDQRRWPAFDLSASVAYQGQAATVLEITPAGVGVTDRYVIKTLFAGNADASSGLRPSAINRVFAVRSRSGWVFTNVIADATISWRRETIGPITYVIAPGYRFDRDRASEAVAFIDSLATAFQVPPAEDVTYYLGAGREEIQRIMGIEWTVGGPGVGYASRANRMVFSGDPGVGENYRHELVHYMLQPLHQRGTHPLVGEGVATWLGGSMGRDFGTLAAEYAAYLSAHPQVTLDAVVDADGPDLGSRPGGAILVLLVFESGGVPAVRDLLNTGRSSSDLRAAVPRITGMAWEDFARRWRERVVQVGR